MGNHLFPSASYLSKRSSTGTRHITHNMISKLLPVVAVLLTWTCVAAQDGLASSTAVLADITSSLLCSSSKRAAQRSLRSCLYNGLTKPAYRSSVSTCRNATLPQSTRLTSCLSAGWNLYAYTLCPSCPSLPSSSPPPSRSRRCAAQRAAVAALKCTKGATLLSQRTAARTVSSAARRARVAAGLGKPGWDTIVLEPIGGRATSTIVFAHGIGYTASGMRDTFLIPTMRTGLALCRTRPVVIPQARVRFVEAFGQNRTAWFDQPPNTEGVNGPFDRPGILEASARMDALVEVVKTLYPGEPVSLMGFSGGGALALTAFMRGEQSVAAAASLSGYLPMPLVYPEEMNAVNQGKKVWMVHATNDELIDVRLIRFLNGLLNQLGRPTTYVEWDAVPHNLAPRGIEAAIKATNFLQAEAMGTQAQMSCPTVTNTTVRPISWKLR